MKENYKMDRNVKWNPTIYKGSLSDISIIKDQQYLISTEINGLQVDIFVYLKSSTQNLIVFNQDAIKRQETALPFFHRWSWYPNLNASIIVFNDPTLYLHNNLDGGWSQGKKDSFGIDALAQVVRIFCKILSIPENEALIFGTSAGGFSAIMLGTELQSDQVVVDIPQVDLISYHELTTRDALFNAVYTNMSKDQVLNNYADRVRVIDRFIKLNQSPRLITYCQNKQDVKHIRTQLNPFLMELATLKENKELHLPEIDLIHYDRLGENGRGHIQMEKEPTVELLNSRIKNNHN